MSMNPRETTEKIRNDYQEYIASILGVKDKQITDLAYKAVEKTRFVKGPYLETTLPFVEGKSLEQLADEGLISKEFKTMGKDVHYSDWNLRIHQEQALRKIITEERNMVVSTGTGSGKTECYLYPIFNELMREKEAGTLDPGVRALLIFPMNALANDQQKKLRKLLRNYPDITFGRYTGETAHRTKKETAEQAERRLHQEYDAAHMNDADSALRKSLPNEMMCREMMAQEPPHILLTNYAMLEYLLLRPDTAPFFDNESAKHWRYIVIDEAHTYKGATGTEIAFLLRRLKERIRHNMSEPFRCIATSATLGSEDAKAGLALFAQNLFGEPFHESDVITTKRIQRDIPSDGRLFMPEDYLELKKRTEGKEENERGRILFNELSKDLRLFRLYKVLGNKPKVIEDVASFVFDDLPGGGKRERALIDLIELAAAAKKSEYESALLPARYHLFIKSLEGMFAQYYPRKAVFLDRKESVIEGDKSYSVFELANCQRCEQEYLVGKTISLDGGDYFVQTSSSDKPEYYFISDEDTVELKEFDEDDSVEESDKMGELEKYHLCLCCGRITRFSEKHPIDCCEIENPKKIVTVYNLKYSGKGNESNCCPCCGATRKGLIKRFLTANQPATFAVAKSLYDAIPPRPLQTGGNKDDIDDIFADDLFDDEFDYAESIPTEIIDESGRKLLIFSDNRQEAAFFAGFFDNKYSQIMWRRVILQCLKEADGETLSVDDLIGRVFRLADKSGLYSFDQNKSREMTDDQKQEMAAHYVIQEFLNPDALTGLEGLGYIRFEPVPVKLKDSVEVAGVHGDDLWNLLRFMMDTLRQKGAVTYPENIRASDDFFEPRNHEGWFRESGSKREWGGYVYGFVPAEKTMNKRLSLMMKLHTEENLEEREAAAREDLKKIYNTLQLLIKRHYLIETQNASKGTVYSLNHSKWNAEYVRDSENLYRCNKCGKVFSYSIKGFCPEMKCNGSLEPVTAKEVKNKPYYRNIFVDNKLIPMVAKEHTAQLSSKTAGLYQKNFEEGKINVLSCSTTFEMGVDVGELEATFQRNVPPETSNYIQRAGRAGRRTSSAAFSVTFSRRNSHDMTFFQEPAKIIAGKIPAPILETDNEKIAERHLNSIIVSWFFKKHPEYYGENTKAIVAYDEGTNMAEALREELNAHPEDLLESIHGALPKHVCDSLNVDDWQFISDLTGDEGSLTKAIEERIADIAGLKEVCSEATVNQSDLTEKELNTARSALKLISTLESEESISFLSAKGVLPKYGFPIDSVSLDIISSSTEEAKMIDLSRDLKMAISEFAPPAEIVANGKVWKSYALNTVPNKGWPAYVYHECPKCKRIYPPESTMVDAETFDLKDLDKKTCESCGTMMNPRKFIIPLFGFSTKMGEKPKPIGETKPSTYYGTRTQFWGIDRLTEKQKAEAKEKDIAIKGKLVNVVYSPGGKLFVLNQGINNNGIWVCPQCGYACDPTTTFLKKGIHETKYRRRCGNRTLIKTSLGHEFSTDILKIKLPLHKVSINLPEGTTPKDQYASVLYALLEGASIALGINRGDISGCVTGKSELVLYDDTAGGSGYVKHIYNNIEMVLKAALNKVSGNCGCTPETSCYGCLRNYSNQYFHDSLSRGLAKAYIEWLLYGEEAAEDVADVNAKVSTSYEEKIGTKKSYYEAVDSSSYPDTETQLRDLLETSENEGVKAALKKLLAYASDRHYEHPVVDENIPVEENIWPELFWGNSHVALFDPCEKNQYQILKKYDWYCYLLDEKIDPEVVFSHIEEGE